MSVHIWLVTLIWLVGCARPLPVIGLRPEYPEPYFDFVEVDSLRPTLRWEAFPRPQDRAADSTGVLGRIRYVTYELRIWRGTEEYVKNPGELVYDRRGLLEPRHTVEESLMPSMKYFWSVRARFELDGQPRVTEWGVTEHPQIPEVGRLPIVPNFLHYRFETPKSEKPTSSPTAK